MKKMSAFFSNFVYFKSTGEKCAYFLPNEEKICTPLKNINPCLTKTRKKTTFILGDPLKTLKEIFVKGRWSLRGWIRFFCGKQNVKEHLIIENDMNDVFNCTS